MPSSCSRPAVPSGPTSCWMSSTSCARYLCCRRLRDITQATTCDCNACLLIPRLDLKFVVHGGQAAADPVARTDLAGTDVIVIHRLLKNHITEENTAGAPTRC